MSYPRPSTLFALCMLVTGCVSLPTYQPPIDQAQADIKLSPNLQKDRLQMCDSGACYVLNPDNGHVRVPENRRIVLYKALVASGYHVMYSCSPGLSFIPRAGINYYADFALRAEKCQFGVYRIDPTNRVGISFDPTVRPLDSGRAS
ncbi:MAG: hypothetical protein WAM90_13900 [Rhodanobacter sp.]